MWGRRWSRDLCSHRSGAFLRFNLRRCLVVPVHLSGRFVAFDIARPGHPFRCHSGWPSHSFVLFRHRLMTANCWRLRVGPCHSLMTTKGWLSRVGPFPLLSLGHRPCRLAFGLAGALLLVGIVPLSARFLVIVPARLSRSWPSVGPRRARSSSRRFGFVTTAVI